MTDTAVFSIIIIAILLVVLAVLRIRHASMQDLVLGFVGAICGLIFGALVSVPVSKLPEPWGGLLPLVLSVVLTITLTAVVLSRKGAILHLLPILKLDGTKSEVVESSNGQILVDTSVIIDGRIADIAAAGFVPGKLIVPRFVLAELQNIADSEDAMRRGRGRRGLEVLNRLRETVDLVVEVTDEDVSGVKEVDAKLVALAQKYKCNVLTTDYNLNRVAAIQGVRVLNVNELSNAIRPVVLPGEELIVRVVQPGKERNQGVGYLADGTMIVVENGDKLMGQEVSTEVTRVFQTVAGKMIFATPRKNGNVPHIPSVPQAPVDVLPSDVNSQADRTGSHEAHDSKVKAPGGASSSKNTGRTGRSRHGSGDRNRQRSDTGSIEDRIVQQNNFKNLQ
jgi:uncharacterized protein YacL